MMKFNEIGFRNANHNIWMFTKQSMTEEFSIYPGYEQANLVVGYGYIDHEEGFIFEILGLAKKTEESYMFYESIPDVSFKLCLGSILEEDFMYIDIEQPELQNTYHEQIEHINTRYRVNTEIETIRSMNELDAYRDIEYPDNLQVYLFKEGFSYEIVYVRSESLSSHCLRCILLNEPYQELGIHRNEWIDVYFDPDNNILYSEV